MTTYSFSQVDVFGTRPLAGNPVAVVLDARGLSMTTRWRRSRAGRTSSETTFLLPPDQPGADYRVRIFTPARGAAVRGPPDAGQRPCLARRLAAAPADGGPGRPGVRGRPRRAPPRRGTAWPSARLTSCASGSTSTTATLDQRRGLPGASTPARLVAGQLGGQRMPGLAGHASSPAADEPCSGWRPDFADEDCGLTSRQVRRDRGSRPAATCAPISATGLRGARLLSAVARSERRGPASTGLLNAGVRVLAHAAPGDLAAAAYVRRGRGLPVGARRPASASAPTSSGRRAGVAAVRGRHGRVRTRSSC